MSWRVVALSFLVLLGNCFLILCIGSAKGDASEKDSDWNGAKVISQLLEVPEEDEESATPGESRSKEGSLSHAKPPKFMLKIYEWRKRQEEKQQSFTTLAEGGRLCHSPEMTTIRSYPVKGMSWKGWMQFRVDQLSSMQKLCDATLRLHFSTKHRPYTDTQSRPVHVGPPLLVRVEVLEHTVDPLSHGKKFSTRKVIAQSHVVSRQRASGYLRINMNVAFSQAAGERTRQFELRTHVLGGHPGSIQLSTNIAGHHSPLLVLFTHELPDESTEAIFDQLSAGKYGKMTKKDNLTPGLLSVLARSARSVHITPPEQATCSHRSTLIKMSEIGLSAVAHPQEFNMTYCVGHCYHVIPMQANPNRHGRLMSLLNSFGRRVEHQVPAPCCGPTKLSGVDLMYWTRTGALVLKYHPEMIVKQCGCW